MDKNRVAAPWLRAAMMEERQRTESGVYARHRSTAEMGRLTWGIVLVMVLAMMAMTMVETQQAHDAAITAAQRAEIVRRWDGREDVGWWVQRELFVLREARNSGPMLEQLAAR